MSRPSSARRVPISHRPPWMPEPAKAVTLCKSPSPRYAHAVPLADVQQDPALLARVLANLKAAKRTPLDDDGDDE